LNLDIYFTLQGSDVFKVPAAASSLVTYGPCSIAVAYFKKIAYADLSSSSFSMYS
jgi:hypothetical protein